MLLRPVEMVKLNVLLLEKHVDGVTQALGDCGFVHLINAASQSEQKLLTEFDREAVVRFLENLLERCQGLMAQMGVEAKPVGLGAESFDLAEIESRLAELEKIYTRQDSLINALVAESGLLNREAERLGGYPFRTVRFSALRDLNHLQLITGRLRGGQLDQLSSLLGDRALILHQPDPANSGDEHVLVLGSRKNRWAIESELSTAGFRQEELSPTCEGSAEEELAAIGGKLGAVRESIESEKRQVQTLAEAWDKPLNQMCHFLRNALQMRRAQQHFASAADLVCISGWIPKNDQERVRQLIGQVTSETGVAEFIDPADDPAVREGREKVPILFADIPYLKPFQQLVSGFGAPSYGDVEPSLYVALSFVLMFGVMFGDVGQGAVIAAIGVYMLKSKRASVARFRNDGWWPVFCGASAMVFGFLYGSVFGYEELLPKLWLRPLHDVLSLFKATVGIGIACISGGILINIINRIRNRQYFEGFLDKFGVIGIVFYWGSIGVGIKAAVAGELSLSGVVVFMALPLLILFLREPLYNLLTRQDKLMHEDPVSFALTSAVEVMEMVTAFLGSTVSFVRLGGFALSHAALCLAIYSLVGFMRNLPWGGFWAIVLIVSGNLFVIALEGLIVTIQGIRLQYYELFSKYFSGDGVLYEPFQLQNARKQEKEVR